MFKICEGEKGCVPKKCDNDLSVGTGYLDIIVLKEALDFWDWYCAILRDIKMVKNRNRREILNFCENLAYRFNFAFVVNDYFKESGKFLFGTVT